MSQSQISDLDSLINALRIGNATFAKKLDAFEEQFGPLSYDQLASIVRDHHHQFFQRFNEESLWSLQDQALLKGLQSHGYQPQTGHGRVELSRLSQQNLVRLSQRHDLKSVDELDPDIQAKLDQIEFSIYRDAENSSIYESHLLSSNQITKYGLGGGINSRNAFNHEFLESDDNVFFFLQIRVKSPVYEQGRSEYGTFRKVLSPAYPVTNIWVSPFMMYPRHLVKFGENALSEKYAGIDFSQEMGGPSFGSFNNHLKYNASPLAVELKNQLHLYDFTIEDYRTLIRRQLGTTLQFLKVHRSHSMDGFRYEDALAILDDQRPKDEERFINSLIYNPLGLAPMEAKVPVAIPAEYLL